MDQLDSAQQIEELNLRCCISHKKPTLSPVGHCYYCDETVRSGVLFCSSECREDWEKERRIKQIAGK